MSAATGTRDTEKCIVNIFGEIYNLGLEADTPYAYAGLDAFNKAYPTKYMNSSLACKYFPARGRRPAIEEHDVPAVLAALKERKRQIGESVLFSSYLVNASKRKTYQAIERAILALERSGGIPMTDEAIAGGITPSAAAPAAAPAAAESPSSTLNEKYLALINLTWHLLHPDAPWPDTVARVKEEIRKNGTIQGLVANIQRADATSAIKEHISPLNYFNKLKPMAPIEKASTLAEAYATAKSAAEADARKAALDKVEGNLSAIIAVLQAHGYMEKSVTAADLSGELVSRIGHTFDPVIAYLRTLYDPVFLFLEKAVKDAPMPIPIGPIMNLIRQAMAAPDGITVADPDVALIAFMKYLAGRIDTHLAGADEPKRGQFYEMLTALPTGKGAVAAAPKKMTGIFPRSEISIKSWIEFDRADRGGYEALVKTGVAASDMRAAYDAAVRIFNTNDLLIVSGATADFPNRITYQFIFKEKPIKLKLSHVLNRMRNYVNTAMLSMIVLIAFRAGLPGGAEVMAKNIIKADDDAAKVEAAAAKAAEAAAKAKAEKEAAGQDVIQSVKGATKMLKTAQEVTETVKSAKNPVAQPPTKVTWANGLTNGTYQFQKPAGK